MEQLIELLQQIQDLAGVAIDALQGATADSAGGEQAAAGGAPEGGGAPPAEGEPPTE